MPKLILLANDSQFLTWAVSALVVYPVFPLLWAALLQGEWRVRSISGDSDVGQCSAPLSLGSRARGAIIAWGPMRDLSVPVRSMPGGTRIPAGDRRAADMRSAAF